MQFKIIVLLTSLILSFNINAQDTILTNPKNNLKVKHFILPTVFIATGLVLRDENLKKQIYDYQREKLGDDFRFKYDDILQNVPIGLAVLGGTFNLKSENSFEQLCTNQLVSLSISGIIGRVIKTQVNDKRPELYGVRAFPSGHTITAFNSATLLFLEYKDANFWYASSGYLFATATAFFRMTNDKHWAADVFAGAGIGMATAYVVHYWSPNLYKYVEKYIFKPKSKNVTLLPYPVIQNNKYGMGLVLNIK